MTDKHSPLVEFDGVAAPRELWLAFGAVTSGRGARRAVSPDPPLLAAAQ